MSVVAKYFVFGIQLYLISAILNHAIAVDLARILNRIFDYWQPNDIYVILNSSISSPTGESIFGTMAYPRYVSARGDFSSFVHNHHLLSKDQIRSVYPDNFVLVMFTDDSCLNVIPILRDQLSREIIVKRSKIVVVASHLTAMMSSTTTTMADVGCLESMFRGLWKTMGLLNVFVLDETFIYGFNPFTKDFLIRHLVGDFKRLIAVDRAANFYGEQLNIPQMDVYPGLQSIVWQNRSRKIGTYYFIQKPFAEFFNATLSVYTPQTIDFGFEFFINSTTSIVHPGIGNDLATGLGNLTLIPRSYSSSRYFDFLSPLYFKECNLLIPKSERIPQYTIVMLIAFSWVGISSLVILVGIVAFATLVKKVLRLDIKMTRFAFELGSVYIGQSLRFPIQTLSMRFLITCWLLTCILLGTLFNAKIVMGFLTPMFYEDYDYPFDAIRKSHASVYTFDDFVYYLKGNSKVLFPSEDVFQLLLKRLKGVTRDEFFRRVLHPNKRDMFMMISMADNLLEKTKYLTEQTYSYHKTKPFFITLTANIVPRGSIIYNHYNDFNYRIFEAGLLQHWKDLELLYERKFGSGGSGGGGSGSNEAQENSLTVGDLYSAFLVLVLGYAVAFAAFTVERCLLLMQSRKVFVRTL